MTDSALRSLLALIRLSFRFDPEKPGWVKPDRTFTRADVQVESGLSSQGARNGLSELAEAGWACADKTGRSYEYELDAGIPSSRYTYVPTVLLDSASGLGGTELRLVFVTLRATWGWTFSPDDKEESAGEPPEHQRWARLSTPEMARRTGRSETAVKEAASQLQGRYLERLRPTGGAYYYRFLPEAVIPSETTEKKPPRSASASPDAPGQVEVRKRKNAYVSMGTSNDLAPDRQRSDPPYTYRECTLERKAKQRAHEEKPLGDCDHSETDPDAMPGSPFPPKQKHRQSSPSAVPSRRQSESPSAGQSPRQQRSTRKAGSRNQTEKTTALSSFSERLQALGKALMNAGVQPQATKQLLKRFSVERIEANFELYRQRAPAVDRPGAWLYSAVTEGYVLPSPSVEPPGSENGQTNRPRGESNSGSSTLPQPGSKISETRKRTLLKEGLATESDFDKFADFADPDRKQHFFRLM